MENSSILAKLAPHLSRYLLLPMFEWEHKQAEERGDEAAIKNIVTATQMLLEPTYMCELQADLHCTLHGLKEPPPEFAQREQELMARSAKLQADTAQLSELLTQDEVLGNLRSDKVANLEYLKNEHAVSSHGQRERPFQQQTDGWTTYLLTPSSSLSTGHRRYGRRTLRLWPVPVPMRQLRRSG
jgi:hypothetical protein